MKTDDLRKLQAPLKQKYRDYPLSAVVTLHTVAKMSEGISCSVDTGKAIVKAGLHPATGGTGSQACSGDMLLQALAACAGVTLAAVSTAIGVEIADATIRAEGDIDFRGTLGVDNNAPVGFESIRLKFDLQTKAPDEQIAKLIELTERYCVVLQTLKNPPKIQVDRNIHA